MSGKQGMTEFVEEMIRSMPEVSQPEKDAGFRQFAKDFDALCVRYEGKDRASIEAARMNVFRAAICGALAPAVRRKILVDNSQAVA